jgi:hypothetical protein
VSSALLDLLAGTRVALTPDPMSSQFAIALVPDGNLIADGNLTGSDDPRPILLRADPSCLVYDRYRDALLVADAYSGAIIQIDGDRQRRIATIGSGGVVGTNRIGGLAITPYGTLFASRLGDGQAGAIFRVEPDGRVEALEQLPPRWWRGGLTYDANEHRLYSTQFMRSRSGPFDGAIVEIDLVTGASSIVADGFLHPIGIVKLGSTLVVTDARQRAVVLVEHVAGRGALRSPLADGIDRPDSICTCGLDSVLVTTFDDVTQRGTVRRIWLDGRMRVIAEGSWEPRGVATDGERVFVATRRAGRVVVYNLYF